MAARTLIVQDAPDPILPRRYRLERNDDDAMVVYTGRTAAVPGVSTPQAGQPSLSGEA
jgi:hypothetical protein